MVAVKGLEKFAPKDFPGFIASTVFLGGCNFRCPYCHNAELVLRPERLADIPMDFFLAYLDSRKGWLEGICVTGGEPLLAEGVPLSPRSPRELPSLRNTATHPALHPSIPAISL